MFEELKPFLKMYVEEITTKDKYKNYICPICGSGTGPNKSPAFFIYDDNVKWKCFSGNCPSQGGDITDLYCLVNNVSKSEAIKQLKAKYQGISAPAPKKEPIKEKEDLTPFLLKAKENLNKPEFNEILDYLHNRGLNDDVLDRFNIGAFIDEYGTKRAVLPRTKYSCLLRAIDNNSFSKMNRGGTDLFNLEAFKEKKQFIYVVEGEIDALSLISEDLPAVALCSTTNERKLVEYLKENPTDKTIYLTLDNDTAGHKAENTLKNELEALNLSVEVVAIPNPYKDPNELYIANKKLFKSLFCDSRLNRLKTISSGNTINNFLHITKEKGLMIPTGINKLDKILNGGLSNELYTIGAMPSIGKSALMGWIADNLSEKGQPVIYYSLEMSETELQARSLSRLSYDISKSKMPKTQGDILKHYDTFNDEEKQLVNDCIEAYKEKAQNLYIITPETPYLEQIINTCKQIKNTLGKSPVLIVDYLQLVDVDPKLKINDAKSRIDYIVKTLKSLTISENMPVILISSLNRAGYRGAVSMEDFKESGIIEFSSNVILGFFFTGIKNFKGNDEAYNDKLNELKQATPREMTINILKNRSGESGGEIYLNYFSKYNRFVEMDL